MWLSLVAVCRLNARNNDLNLEPYRLSCSCWVRQMKATGLESLGWRLSQSSDRLRVAGEAHAKTNGPTPSPRAMQKRAETRGRVQVPLSDKSAVAIERMLAAMDRDGEADGMDPVPILLTDSGLTRQYDLERVLTLHFGRV